jgi:hypothetical protein
MQLRLPANRRPVVTVFGAVVFGALLAGGAPRLTNFVDRPACAEKVMQAISTDSAVSGSYNCFDTEMQVGLQSVGIDSDKTFADKVGIKGEYHFVQKTNDGGYVYEYDHPLKPHDRVKGAIAALGLPGTQLDIRRGDLGAAFNEHHDLGAAWAELTGQTQGDKSQVFTFYFDGSGKITAVK